MKKNGVRFVILLVTASIACCANFAFAAGPDSELRADRRPGGAPPVPRMRPTESSRIAASYDPENAKGPKVSFVGTVRMVGNEPHSTVVVTTDDKKNSYEVTPMDAAEDLGAIQNKRVEIEALLIDAADGPSGTTAAIRVLSWKIVK